MTKGSTQDTSEEILGTSAGEAAASLPGSIQSAPPGQKGFDSDTVILAALAGELAILGYKFAIRYISLEATEQPGDLTHGEALTILNGGLAVSIRKSCERACQ